MKAKYLRRELLLCPVFFMPEIIAGIFIVIGAEKKEGKDSKHRPKPLTVLPVGGNPW